MSLAAQAAVEEGAEAMRMFTQALRDFQSACVIGDWKESERVRNVAKDSLDCYFDKLAFTYRVNRNGSA